MYTDRVEGEDEEKHVLERICSILSFFRYTIIKHCFPFVTARHMLMITLELESPG